MMSFVPCNSGSRMSSSCTVQLQGHQDISQDDACCHLDISTIYKLEFMTWSEKCRWQIHRALTNYSTSGCGPRTQYWWNPHYWNSSQKVRCHLSGGGSMLQIHGIHCSIHSHLCKQRDLCTSSLSDQTICVHCSFMILLFSYTQTHTQRYKHTHTLIHIFRYRHAHTYTHAHIQTLMHDLTPAHTVLMRTQNQTKMKWLTQLQKFLNNLATYPKHHGKWT